MAAFFRLRAEGIDIFVRLTPRSSRDVLEGVEQTDDGRAHLAARVRASPDKGAANAALERLVASAFGVSPSGVSIVSGATARRKTVRISGDASELERTAMRLGLPHN